MVISLFTRRRRALALLVLAAASLALALGAMLGAANQSAQATVRAHVKHAVHRTHVQSGDQSAPDNQTGAGSETTGESTTPETDGPGGANVGGDCTGACVQ